jgi:polysaccharide export outer membrane protein
MLLFLCNIPIMAADYKLSVDDQLKITVWGHSDLNQPTILVGPDGTISFPLVGEVKAAGLTTDELKNVLTKKLSEYMVENAEELNKEAKE